MFFCRNLRILMVTVAPIFFSVPVIAASLTIEVGGLRNNKGAIIVGIYDSSESFPKVGQAVRRVELVLSDTKPVTEVDNIPEGQYAVALLHDENQDGKLNKNLFGIPKEGYGFSNNAKAKLGPPSFKDASFKVGPEASSIKIDLSY